MVPPAWRRRVAGRHLPGGERGRQQESVNAPPSWGWGHG